MQKLESTLNVSKEMGQKEAIGVECGRRLDILAEFTMGEEAEEERGWKEEGVLVRGPNTQVNGFGVSTFTGDDKVQSVIVAKGWTQHKQRASGDEARMGASPRKVGQRGRGQRDSF